MSELSSEARALVSDGRSALRPTTEDRARVASRLATRLGAVAILAAQPGYAAPKVAGLSKFSSIVAAVGLVGASAVYSFTRPVESAVVAPAPVRAVNAPMVSPMAPSEPRVAPETTELEARAARPAFATTLARKEPTTPSTEGLAEEVALLSRATSQLRGGDAAGALASLEQHQRQFPAGRLLEERLSARAQALCVLGRSSEAEAELARLMRSAPRSPHVARARRACGL
jgi:hypothetical protein